MSFHSALSELSAQPQKRDAFAAVFTTAHAAPIESVAFMLDEHVDKVCGAAVDRVLFATLKQSATFGLELTDGQRVVVKAHGPRQSATHVLAAYAAQSGLAESGFALFGERPIAPSVVGLKTVGDVVLATMVLRDEGETQDAARPRYRKAVAETLVRSSAHLSDLTAPIGLTARTQLDVGVRYPPPPAGLVFRDDDPHATLIDAAADRAHAVLHDTGASRYVIGHCDWSARHMRFVPGRAEVSVVFGWDALAHVEELILYARAAARFAGENALDFDAMRGFLSDVEVVRERGFSPAEHLRLAAFFVVELAFGARCRIPRGDATGHLAALDAAIGWLETLRAQAR